jgi:hypothetical protein
MPSRKNVAGADVSKTLRELAGKAAENIAATNVDEPPTYASIDAGAHGVTPRRDNPSAILHEAIRAQRALRKLG